VIKKKYIYDSNVKNCDTLMIDSGFHYDYIQNECTLTSSENSNTGICELTKNKEAVSFIKEMFNVLILIILKEFA